MGAYLVCFLTKRVCFLTDQNPVYSVYFSGYVSKNFALRALSYFIRLQVQKFSRSAHYLHFYQFSNHITQFTGIGQSWLSWTPSTKHYKMITTKILDPTKEPHDIKNKS